MAALVVTVVGDDQSGLVSALAAVVAKHGGNWEESQMSQLAGKFAGVVLITVPDGSVDAFLADLEPLQADGLFDITAVRGAVDAVGKDATPARYRLQLVGTDRPGIINEISAALANRNVSIEDLRTLTRDAPMSGGVLFEAAATLVAPAESDAAGLEQVLEALADELMVDIEFTAT